MGRYNIVYKVLYGNQELVVTPLVLKKILADVSEIEKRAYTDDQFNALIEEEVKKGLR